MNGKKQLPSQDQLRDYNHAVAGHAGTLCDADGELFIKPCTQTEINWYQAIEDKGLHGFQEIMPVYMGELRLSDPADVPIDDALVGVISDSGNLKTTKEQIAATIAEQVAKAPAAPPTEPGWVPSKGKKIKTDRAVVLENASYGYKKANILDVKLGKRLWADDAPPEKKRRFDTISSETTHGKLGFRIAGMRVYHGSANESEWDKEGYKIYDKDYGRVAVNNENVVREFRKFVFNKEAGIDGNLGKAVCSAFVRDLKRVEEVLSENETRMYSSSLLFVFEGDGKTLRAAIEENNELVDKVIAPPVPYKPVERTNKRMDSGIALNEDEYDDSDEEGLSLPQIFTLKLIDFAHAQLTPGQGPDENILLGVRSLIRIFLELAGEEN